jgi:hypothetical protein
MCNLYLWMDWMWNKRYDAQVTQDGLSMNGLAYIIMFAASLTPTSRIYVHSTAATAKKHCPVGFNCPTPWCRTFWFCLQSLWRRAQLSRSRRMILKLWNHAKISCGLVHCTTWYLIRYTSHQWRGCLIRVSEALELLLVVVLPGCPQHWPPRNVQNKFSVRPRGRAQSNRLLRPVPKPPDGAAINSHNTAWLWFCS